MTIFIVQLLNDMYIKKHLTSFIRNVKHGILWIIVTLFVKNIRNINLERTMGTV